MQSALTINRLITTAASTTQLPQPPNCQDDERTLEDEEKLVAKDEVAAKREQDEELQGLDEEADLPLEELLKRSVLHNHACCGICMCA